MSTVNLTTWSDAACRRRFQYTTQSTGAPIDLTGSSLRMMVRRRAEDAEAFIDISTANGGITIDDAAAGKFTILLPKDKLSKMAAGDYVHSLIRTSGGLDEDVWHGTLTHSIGPTR